MTIYVLVYAVARSLTRVFQIVAVVYLLTLERAEHFFFLFLLFFCLYIYKITRCIQGASDFDILIFLVLLLIAKNVSYKSWRKRIVRIINFSFVGKTRKDQLYFFLWNYSILFSIFIIRYSSIFFMKKSINLYLLEPKIRHISIRIL